MAILMSVLAFYPIGYSANAIAHLGQVHGFVNEEELFIGLRVTSIVLGVFSSVFYTLLFVGSYMRNWPLLMSPALQTILINIVYLVIYIIIYLVLTIQRRVQYFCGILYICGTLADVSLNIYFFVVIHSLIVCRKSQIYTVPA